jgi:hypothetical protein
MRLRPALQALRPAVRAGWSLLLCGAASLAAAAEPSLSPLSGSYNPWSDPWMIGQSRWSLGVVAEPRYVPPWSFSSEPRSTSASSVVLGMNLSSSGNARLVWYAPVAPSRLNTLAGDTTPILSANDQALDPNGVPLPTPLRVGLVLKPSDPWSDLRQGSLTKLELSGHMALSLRSNKGGGVWLALSGRW